MTEELKKVIKDDEVAVIYHPNFGIGWYTHFCWIKQLLFDPKLVEIILHPNYKTNRYNDYYRKQHNLKFDEELHKKVKDYIEEVNNRNYIIPYGRMKGNKYTMFYDIIYELDIYWVPVGEKFTIENYDGQETVFILDDNEFIWVTA